MEPATPAPAVRTPPGAAACPRCSTPITGDYKFCPACAHRLQRDAVAADDGDRRGRRRSAFFGAAASALVVGAVGVGLVLFHPGWLAPEPAPPTPAVDGPSDWESYAHPAFTVADLPRHLVDLPPGFAFEVPIAPLPAGDPWDDVRARFPEEQSLAAWTWYRMSVLAYEVTRGQYDEFLHDLLGNPDHLPHVWQREIDDGQRADVREVVHAHVPRSWRVVEGDRVVGWSLPEPDRNLPVVEVSCIEAQAFCEWASDRIGLPVRLPMALEWVRAARAGKRASPDGREWAWPWGPEPLRYACNHLGSFAAPQFVHYRYSEPDRAGGATPEGLFACAGNVAEWALDHDIAPLMSGPSALLLNRPPSVGWRPYPPERAPTWALAYGGSFRTGIGDCRVDVYRRLVANDASRDDVGFRIVHVPDAEER